LINVLSGKKEIERQKSIIYYNELIITENTDNNGYYFYIENLLENVHKKTSPE